MFNDVPPKISHLNKVYDPWPLKNQRRVYIDRHNDMIEAEIETIALALLTFRPNRMFVTKAIKGKTGIKCARFTISLN
jgi:hypothetical protein